MNELRGWREVIAITAIAVVLVVYFTFPLAIRPGSLGRVDSGDGQFSIWNIAWVAHALISSDAVFDANIFHPLKGTLAYSEANLGAGVLAVPGYWLTKNAYVAHNTAMLLGLTISVIGMYFLARRLSGNRAGALVAAIVFTFCPFLFAHTAHIQLLMIGPLPFIFLALHEFVDRPTFGSACILGFSIAVQGLFCGYYGVLGGLLAGLGVLYYFSASRGLWRRPHWWGLALVAGAVAIVAVLPFFLRYLELQKDTGFGRGIGEAREYSADWRAYLASSAWLHDWMLKHLGTWNEVLFPGFAAIAFGAAGIVAGLKRSRETTIFYLLVGLLAVWSSFGPAAGLYSLLYHTIPVFSLLRAPARFGLALSFALAIFSAFGVAALLAAQPAGRRGAVAAACILFAVINLSMTMPFRPVGTFPRAYEVLAQSRPGSVAEFPFYYNGYDFHRHTQYLLGSTVHWQRLVNGYSDYIPRDFARMARPLSSFPNPEGFGILRARRARYVVFHLALYDWRNREALLYRLQQYRAYLQPRLQDGDVWLFEIVKWPDRHPDLSDPAPNGL